MAERAKTGRLVYDVEDQLDHGRQVSNLAYLVGKELGLSDEECRDLIIAGFFHDIGKSELKEAAQKTDKPLVVEEMNDLRLHPKISYQILKRHGYSQEICDSVRYHHENYDGSGYPDNLQGNEIPLGACILRVCDVFCALTSDRVYRSAYSLQEAMNLMIDDISDFNIKVFLAFQRVVHGGPDGEIRMPEERPEVRGVWKKIWQ